MFGPLVMNISNKQISVYNQTFGLVLGLTLGLGYCVSV